MNTPSAVIKSAVSKKFDTKTLALLGIALAYQLWPSAAASKPHQGQQQLQPSMSIDQSMSSQDIEQIRQQQPLRSVK